MVITDMGALNICIMLLQVIIYVKRGKKFFNIFLLENDKFRCPIVKGQCRQGLKTYNKFQQILVDIRNRFFKSCNKTFTECQTFRLRIYQLNGSDNVGT